MRHASFASGIGGFDLGFERAGIESVFQCEADKFCLSVLEHHWPDVPKHHDLRSLTADEIPEADVWSCGFPCQDISVAGRRVGLEGERSNLWFDFAGLVEQRRPSWVVVENVPGLLSSTGGADMALIVGQLSGFGYGVAWRVLDSQFFGVPQRRRRVYIVGHLGDLSAFEVLFEREGSGGDPAQGGGEAKDIAYTLAGSPRGTGDGHGNAWNTTYALTGRGPGERREAEATYIAYRKRTRAHGAETSDETWDQSEQADALAVDQRPTTLMAGLRASDGHHGHSSPRGDGGDNLIVGTVTGSEAHNGNSRPIPDNYVVGTLRAPDANAPRGPDGKRRGGGPGERIPIIAFNWQSGGDNRSHPQEGRTDALQANQTIAIGAPTDPDRMREAPGIPRRLDSPRYHALGNAVTVNVTEWIGRRLIGA